MRRALFASRYAKKIGANAFWMLISRFGGQAMAVVFTVLIARRLDSAGFGAYAFITAILFVANTLTTFGTDMLLIREIASKNDVSRLPAALILQLLLSGAIILLIWIGGGWIPNQDPETVGALKIYSLALIPLAFFTIFTIVLRGEQRMDAYMLLNLATAVLQVGAALIPGVNIINLSVYLLAVQTLVTLIAGWMCTETMMQILQVRSILPREFAALLKEAAPIALLALVGMIYQRLNITMLSTMKDAMQTGFYAAASRIVEASKGLHIAMFAALYPMMAQATGESIEQLKMREIFSASWKILLGSALLIALIFSRFAGTFINFLYGDNYAESVHVLIILAWALVPYTINAFLTLSMLALHHEHYIIRALTISLIGLVLMNFWWIPLKGSEGSAWAALGAEALQASLLVIMYLRLGQTRKSNELSQLPEQIRN